MKELAISTVKKYFRQLVLFVIMAVVIVALEVGFNIYFGNFVDYISQGMNASFILRNLIIITVLFIILTYIYHVMVTVYNDKAMHDINFKVLEELQRTEVRFFDRKSTDNMTQDVNIDSFAVSSFITYTTVDAIKDLLMIILIVSYIYYVNKTLFLTLLPGAVILIIIYNILKSSMQKKQAAYLDAQSRYFTAMFSMIYNIHVVKAHVLFGELAKGMDTIYSEFQKRILETEKLRNLFTDITLFVVRAMMVAVCLSARVLIESHGMTVGNFVVISLLLIVMIPSLNNILNYGKAFQEVKVNYKRLDDYINLKKDENGDKIINSIDDLKIENLQFQYDKEGEFILKGFNYDFNRGHIYHLKGKNGSGKSTLVSIILGLFQDYEGNILYNGVNFKNIDTYNLRRKKISYVEQQPIVNSLSVRDNLLFGIDEYDEDNYKFVYDAFLKKEFKEDDIISMRTVSGGQKQKFVICRALIKNGDMLIMDEPTSSLDSESKKILKEIIKKISNKKIIIIISHDEDFIDICDETIELQTH